MTRTSLALLVILALAACEKKETVSFIPASPMTAAENVRATASNASLFTYRTEDVLRGLDGLEAGDQVVAFCPSKVIEGAMRLILQAPPGDGTVTVKTTSCSPVEGGMNCGVVNATERGFYKSPDNFFLLQDGVTQNEADRVMYLFETKGILNIPEQFSRFDFSTVMAIGKSAEIFRLSLSDPPHCETCSAQVSVVITAEDELALVGEPVQQCIQ